MSIIPWPSGAVTPFLPACTLPRGGLVFRSRDMLATAPAGLILPVRSAVTLDDVAALEISEAWLAAMFPVPTPGRLLFVPSRVSRWLLGHCQAAMDQSRRRATA